MLELAQFKTTPDARAALVQFPTATLNNTYFLVRSGESYVESDGKIQTNPAWKTAMSVGLSDLGKRQVLEYTLPTVQKLSGTTEDDANFWIWTSITQGSYQTAEILAYGLGLGRNRIVPEYSFLDARGVGAYEGGELSYVTNLVGEGDFLDSLWKPPKGYDGTPNESVEDVLVRVRQVLSITETQYLGSDIIIIAPDSDTLSILQAAILGVDLRQHNSYSFRPGEVRVLQLSASTWDDSPSSFACARPPACL